MNKRHTAEFLAAAVAIATGTPAYAEVIIFINPDPGEPGHFDWTMVAEDQFTNQDIYNSGDASVWLAHLDITRPSTDQVGFVGVGQIFRFTGGFPEGWTAKNYNLPQSDEYQPFALARIGASTRTRSLLAGASIGGQLDFIAGSIHASCSDYGGANCGSAFQAGVPSYMGVRFSFESASSDTPTSYHYGWIGVVRVGTYDLDAFAWGYETEPGVPIIAGIPAPGTLAALAFGAVVTRRGRKRPA